MGLNDSYSVIRGTILLQNPLPSLSPVYNNLLQEERQREIHNETQFPTDSASFYAKIFKNNRGVPFGHTGGGSPNAQSFRDKSFVSDSRKSVTCNYCKKPGHAIDKCYKLQYNRTKRLANAAPTASHDAFLGGFDERQINSSAVPSLAQDLDPAVYQQLLQVLSNAQRAAPVGAAQIMSSSSYFAGTSAKHLVFFACHSSWILDTGASDHMCYNNNMFSDIRTIPQPYVISLPNGHSITINNVGTVPLTREISLHNVLFVPSFRYNLLSISKLDNQFNSVINFTPDFCFMQGSSMKQPLILGTTHKDLYLLQATPSVISCSSTAPPSLNSAVSAVNAVNPSVMWHNRLGHLPLYKLRHFPFCKIYDINESDISSCLICAKARQNRLSFTRGTIQTCSPF
ncbi:hypothetical protein RND81_03G105000 [Saponaria officinalis]|uniref:Retrovirus-related Pol polyprotein from transposon TNT 1-94-like beta-barrel domain-containing protein n=1 Tax=Saponaria officinalis TaxID=3572 RepID=A0AAW1M583_SAPOF